MTKLCRGDYFISTDRSLLDLDVIHDFLSHCYWAEGIPRAVVARSLEHSLCFGLYCQPPGAGAQQAGFARVISDFATFAYLGDVFILPEHRNRGLGKWLMESILQHPELQGLRRWSLVTRDAHRLYSELGFHALKSPERHMEIHRPDVYGRGRT